MATGLKATQTITSLLCNISLAHFGQAYGDKRQFGSINLHAKHKSCRRTPPAVKSITADATISPTVQHGKGTTYMLCRNSQTWQGDPETHCVFQAPICHTQIHHHIP
jgi:hypothetical protein